MKETYWLDYGKQKVSKKDAVKAGCYVSEFSDIPTKNDRVQSTESRDKEKAGK